MFFTPPTLLLSFVLLLLERPDGFFDHPETLCRALEGKGVRTGAWTPLARDQKGRPQMHTPYTCEYPVPGAAAGAVKFDGGLGLLKVTPPNLIFRVSGNNVRQADSVTIAVTLAPTGPRAEAKNRLLESIRLLFQTTGQSLPRGLPPSIERERRFRTHEPYGSVSFLPLNGPTRKEHVLWFQMRRKTSR